MLQSGEMRIVLTWNNDLDLDSHISGIDAEGNPTHAYFVDKVQTLSTGETVASLDIDVIPPGRYGPETITLHTDAMSADPYLYSVHDYTNRGKSNSDQMSGSGAMVNVYQGASEVARYEIDPNTPAVVWDVFEVDNQGNVVSVNVYNPNATSAGNVGSSHR